MTCQSCTSANLRLILDLGRQPICNKFRSSLSAPEKTYPLQLVRCLDCSLVQLSCLPPVGEIFGADFNYLSGSSQSVVRHYRSVAEDLYQHFSPNYVLAIGSNDGAELQYYKERGAKVLGIDPAPKAALIANGKGIATVVSTFEDATIEGRPDLITAFDVVAHTPTLHPFLSRLTWLMRETRAPFVMQCQYLPDMMERCEYDTIYHEHARFFTIKSLARTLQHYGIAIREVKHNDFYGGSMLVFCELSSEVRIPDLPYEEPYSGAQVYEDFAEQAIVNRLKLRGLVRNILDDRKVIAGIGAPMKSSTLLNFCGLTSREIAYLCETNPLKVGTFAPGSRIAVVSEDEFFRMTPHYALILSWNMAEPIMEKYRDRGYRGKFIVPVPVPRVVE